MHLIKKEDYFMENLEWQGNSRKMYETVLNQIPVIFKSGIKKKIADWINKNNIKVVTEDTVFKAVNDIAPESLANTKIKPELEKLRTI